MLDQTTSTPADGAGRSVAQTWDEAASLLEWLASAPAAERTPALYERLSALETVVLEEPIRSRGDAIAKLKAVQLSVVICPRDDELDVDAFAEAIAWLEVHP